MRKLFVLFVLFVSVSASAIERLPYTIANEEERRLGGCDTLYTMPDVVAEFPGGRDAMYDFFFKELKGECKLETYLSSKMVLMKLFITSAGDVAGFRVMHAFSQDCAGEVGRVVKMFPKFTPALQGGRPVCSYKILKLYFKP